MTQVCTDFLKIHLVVNTHCEASALDISAPVTKKFTKYFYGKLENKIKPQTEFSRKSGCVTEFKVTV